MTPEPKTKEPAISGPPEPSQIAQAAIAEHLSTGGSTIDPRTGKSLAGTRNIAVGIAPEHAAVHARALTPQDHDNFVAAHAATLAKHSNSAVGTHHDQETGLHHLEIVGLTPSKTAALDMAAHMGENHAHNLATDEKIPTGATEPKPSHLSVDERFAHLRSVSPKRETYTGTHFSDKKLDKIEGARRGEQGAKKMPATNADAERIHAGTKTGMGPDAPAGFYSVRAGHSAPALEAMKPHAHLVRGQFALASTEHPAFQQGYANGSQHAAQMGADPKTAHYLGLNTAENALQDEGFDGYHSPAHPGIVFHFGDHEIATPSHEHTQPKPQR